MAWGALAEQVTAANCAAGVRHEATGRAKLVRQASQLGSRTHVTELVYRHQLRPVIESGAIAMERLFANIDAGETGGESA